MRRHRASILRRRRVFAGCEGESERGYIAWLQQVLDVQRRDTHLEAVLLKPGAGDPPAVIDLALRRLVERERAVGERYRMRLVLLDADRRDEAPERRDAALHRARAAGLRLIWQEPCHEAFLLRHLPGRAAHRPPTSALAGAALQSLWPDYAKGMSAARLAARLGLADLRRALRVEATLRAFLAALGFRP